MITPVRLVRVRANGRRFLFLNEHRDIVECRGEVQCVNGFSAQHGPNRRFKRNRVEILEVDLTENLLQELLEET